MAATLKRVEISLNFMPAFYHKHIGVRYGEAYYFDPSYRAEVERAEGKFLNKVFGDYGVGSADPEPSANIFIQPLDVVMRTQGAQWRFPEDGCVESWNTPWEKMAPGEIAKIDANEAAHHPVIDDIIAEHGVMERMYGNRADVFSARCGVMNVHTPYTTAQQLCGEELFVLMLTDPASATVIFNKVWEIYRAIFRRIADTTGARLTRVHLGDCAASMLSAKTYREVVLPTNRAIAAEFKSASYHSCGPSSHLLHDFALVPNLTHIELGPGTDLAAGTHLMPAVKMSPLIDPVMVREADPDSVRREVEQIVSATQESPGVTLCAWSFDRDTPLENVEAIYAAVQSCDG